MLPSNPNDHDILLSLARDMCWLKKGFANHLKHHWAIHIAVFGALLGLVATLLLK